MLEIKARERLENIVDIGIAFSSPDDSRELLMYLAEQAYGHDDNAYGQVLEGITRKRR